MLNFSQNQNGCQIIKVAKHSTEILEILPLDSMIKSEAKNPIEI